MCEKYWNQIPKPNILLKSSIGSFKNYHKDIKAICKENEKEIQCWVFLYLKTDACMSLLQTYKQKHESLYMHSFRLNMYFSVYKFLSCMSVIGYIKN